MRFRVAALAAGVALAGCGGGSTSVGPTTTTNPSPGDSLTNVWLSPAANKQPTLIASAQPDRLWLLAVVPAGKGMALVQLDDEDRGYLTYYEDGERRWQQQFDGYVTSAAFVGDAIAAAVRSADSRSTDLVVYPTADGALLQHATLQGEYRLRTIGDSVYLVEETEQRVSISRLDPKALAPVDTLSVGGLGGLAEVDQGLLVWSAGGTDLIDLTTWSTQHWAAGASPDSIAPIVLGPTLVSVSGDDKVVGHGTDGTQPWSVAGLDSGITGLAALGTSRFAVATASEVDLVDVDGIAARIVDRWKGECTLGPTAIVDGRGYVVCFDGTTGHLLVDSDRGLVDLATFEGGSESNGSSGSTFVDGALYVAQATKSDEPGPASEVLFSALSLDDGHTLWSIHSAITEKANVRWAVESGAIVARLGSTMIPGLVEVYG